MKKILKEPLLHFIIIGTLFFLIYSVVNNDVDNKTVVVSKNKITQLQAVFIKTWKREPSKQELVNLIDTVILEEIYYREAVALGLDKDDVIIKRRLKQKMEFISADIIKLLTPDDEQLEKFLQENSNKFSSGDSYDFSQIFINPSKHDSPEKFANSLLISLGKTANLERAVTKGDSTMLPEKMISASVREIERSFGHSFVTELDKLVLNKWTGPVYSSFGIHLIYLEQRQKATVPMLNDIRASVEQEWAYAEKTILQKALNKRLKENYRIVVEWPNSKTNQQKVETQG